MLEILNHAKKIVSKEIPFTCYYIYSGKTLGNVNFPLPAIFQNGKNCPNARRFLGLPHSEVVYHLCVVNQWIHIVIPRYGRFYDGGSHEWFNHLLKLWNNIGVYFLNKKKEHSNECGISRLYSHVLTFYKMGSWLVYHRECNNKVSVLCNFM